MVVRDIDRVVLEGDTAEREEIVTKGIGVRKKSKEIIIRTMNRTNKAEMKKKKKYNRRENKREDIFPGPPIRRNERTVSIQIQRKAISM